MFFRDRLEIPDYKYADELFNNTIFELPEYSKPEKIPAFYRIASIATYLQHEK